MSVLYEQASEEVHRMAREILEQHHPELRMLGQGEYVQLCILMAFQGEESDEPAVKCHGYPAAAVISIIPFKQRVDKRADAEIVIDREQWERDLTEPQQRALLDHQISHLEIQVDENKCVKTDDIGRPKLKLRLCDWNLRGFRSIANRYGADALEVIAARQFDKDFGDDVLAKSNLFSSATGGGVA